MRRHVVNRAPLCRLRRRSPQGPLEGLPARIGVAAPRGTPTRPTADRSRLHASRRLRRTPPPAPARTLPPTDTGCRLRPHHRASPRLRSTPATPDPASGARSVSSCKPRNSVASLRDDSLDTYWQSDGAQPHLVNIQFQKKVQLQLVVLYVDFKLDESYTPSKISIRAGDGFHNLKEIKMVDLLKPVGWVHISLSGTDPRETFIHTFMLQIAVLANHLNRRDTHVRQIKIYGPRP
ncbi:anaphase-promoting complex subunit 10-like [Triticum aestivum]|uniref:anaphase-promoting complex subunit 10-like n=1 Tax=Triticum aestivum TaxID=4565 RepID=UPI001D022557|nr:anaphase-promoting complex subunit 10-like [Triticum aestivum]